MLLVEHVSKSYRGRFIRIRSPVLKNISLSIAPGETVALVGESGSGKSTLARVILGLEPCDSGQITCMGIPVKGRRSRRKNLYRQLQPVFQDSTGCLNPRMSIRGILEEPIINYADMNKRDRGKLVENLLKQVELPTEILSRYPGEISGGQQRRVCIARALAISPAYLILDEATAGIDATVTRGIIQLLMSLQNQRKCGYLFITHDLNMARVMADKTLVMRGGEIVEAITGTVDSNTIKHPYTKALYKLT